MSAWSLDSHRNASVKRSLVINTVVAVVAAVAGFAIYRYAIAPAPETVPVATPAATEAAPTAATPVGQTLPEFSLQDRAGKMVSIRSWPDKSLIVNFWATWCAPCRKEIPLLSATNKARAPDGFQVVGIAVDVRESVLKYADEIKLDYPLLIGEQDGLDALHAFGIESAAFPVTIFTDRQGRIVTTHLGEIDQPKMDILLDVVSKVNAGALEPAQARTEAATRLEQL